jgi:hypothetical protein
LEPAGLLVSLTSHERQQGTKETVKEKNLKEHHGRRKAGIRKLGQRQAMC